ncbi:M23 family metallopeptidase [Roseovarius sp. 2305UL8-3]|uniref:M23 family metallopeptidase n=1 Tax=Roseovarius conchicola TaxID=3121636 RepID=UPI003526C86A
MRAVALGSFVLIAQAAHAGPPELYLPLDCTLGQTCYIEDYVDADPGDGMSDFTCGIKSRDGHRGTDIVLQSFEAMETGVSVLAAAPGVVAATRDSMPDIAVTVDTRDKVKGQECGNAVRIDHGDGWQTLYCHMKQGSVAVQTGDWVSVGDPLGLVGLSGLTNIPHVHLTVLKDGKVIDPFAPDADGTCDRQAGQDGLWATPPAYDPTGLFNAGFSTSVPSFEAVKSGAARATTSYTDEPLVLYAHAFHAQPGDLLEVSATGPDGIVFETTIPLEDPQVQLFRAYGRKAPDAGWPVGDYRGMVRLMRSNELIAWRRADITITSR